MEALSNIKGGTIYVYMELKMQCGFWSNDLCYHPLWM